MVWKFEVLKNILQRIRFHLPSKLPRGSQEFEDFCDSIFEVYKIPKTDSYKHALAAMIQHLDPQTIYQSKSWFAASIYNAQAREVAFYKIQEIQKKERETAAASLADQAEPKPH